MPIVIKLGSIVTNYDGLPPIKSLDPLIKWSCEVTN